MKAEGIIGKHYKEIEAEEAKAATGAAANIEVEVPKPAAGPEPLVAGPPPFAAETENPERTTTRVGFGRDIGSRGSRTGRPPAPFEPRGTENYSLSPEAKILKELREKMDNLAELYAKYSGEAYASQGFIKRLVGWHKESDPMIEQYRNEWIKAKDIYEKTLNDNLEKKFRDGKMTEKEYRAQTIQLKGASLMGKLANDEKKMKYQTKKGESRGWLSDKVEKGADKFIQVWKSTPFFLKLGTGIGLGLIGGPASVIGLGALRVIGAVAGGKATQEKLQALALEKRKRDIEKEMRQFEMSVNLIDVNELNKLAHERLDVSNGKLSKKIVSESNWDAGRKITGILTGAAMEELSRLGVTRALLNKGLDWLGYGGVLPVAETGGGKGGVTTPETAGKGAVIPEKVERPFLGDTHTIESGENIWKVMRDLYVQHADNYGYNDVQAQRIFSSYKENGLLGRLGIKGADNFIDLTDDQKHKIWAEWKTGKEIEFYKSWHGGSIKDLVHAGDMVTMDQNGHIFFGDTSGIRAGYLPQSHDVPQGLGRAAADNYGQASGGETLEFAPGNKFQKTGDLSNPFAYLMSDGNYYTLKGGEATFYASGTGGHGAGAGGGGLAEVRGGQSVQELAAKAAEMDSAQAHKWMDFIQERMYGKGTTVDWHQPAREFRNKFLGSFITSDQPMGPPADVGDQGNLWRAAQEINGKLGLPIGNETTEEWLTRGLEQGKISSEDMMRTLNRVINQ